MSIFRRRFLLGFGLALLLSSPSIRAQSVILSDSWESGSISSSIWPQRSGGTVENAETYFGSNNNYLSINGSAVKLLSADWSQRTSGRVTTFAFDYYEATNSGDYLVAGYAGATDINTADAFVRISIGPGLIAFNATTGVVQTATGITSYSRGRRLTFSLILNDSLLPQSLEDDTLPGKSMQVWVYDWQTGVKAFALSMSVADSTRTPVSIGFRTWSTSTNVHDYFDNVKLIDGAMVVTGSFVPTEVPPAMPIPPRPFVHPCVFQSPQDIERMNYRINNEPGSAAALGWNQMIGNSLASLNYQHVPYSNVVVMGSGTTPSETQYRNDSQAARALALRWVVTGDTRYRDKARTILNDWGATFVTMSPASGTSSAQIDLEAAWAAPVWVAAADLMRYYNGGAGGWASNEIARLDNMLNYLYTEASQAAYRENNWGASAALAMITVGAYQENRTRFNAGIQTWRDRLAGINAAVNSYNDDSIIEVCRDTIHPQYTLQVWMQAAETAWMHGIDLYGMTLNGDTRPQFAKNLEFFAELFLGLRQPPCPDSFLTNYNYFGEQNHSGAYDIGFNHYVTRMGFTWMTNYTDVVLNHWRPGGFDAHFCGWSTMTHGDLSVGLPAVMGFKLWNLSSGTASADLTNGTSLNLRTFGSNYTVKAETSGTVASVQFYTNGAAFGPNRTNTPFLSSALPPAGNYFLSAVPRKTMPAGSIPGDQYVSFLRVVDLPGYWSVREIGAPGVPAWASESNGNYTVCAAGTGAGSTADQIGFVATEITGDLQITARITSIQSASASARAGIMLRSSSSPGGRMAFLSLAPSGSNRLSWQWRAVDSGSTTTTNQIVPTGPVWLRVLRLGDQVGAYYSADSLSWTVCGATNLSMPGTVQIGLAVASAGASASAQANFESVFLEPLNQSYSEWREWVLTRRGITGALSDPSADPDGDGKVNQVEYWLGSDSLASEQSPALRIAGMSSSSVRLWVTERKNAADYGRVFLRSTDLVTWAAVTPDWTADVEDLGSVVVREITFPLGPSAAFYTSSYSR